MSLIQETIANTKDSTRMDNFKPDESNGMHFPCSACLHCNGAESEDANIPSECRACRYFFD